VTFPPETGPCSHTGGCSTTPGTWPMALQRRARLLRSRTEAGEGAVSARVGSAPCLRSRRGLGPTELGDLGAPFIPDIAPSPPRPTRACSAPLSPLALTQLHVQQSPYAAGEHNKATLGCRLQSTPSLADPSPGPSSPHISIQHGARVEGGEGVAVRGLLWRVQLE